MCVRTGTFSLAHGENTIRFNRRIHIQAVFNIVRSSSCVVNSEAYSLDDDLLTNAEQSIRVVRGLCATRSIRWKSLIINISYCLNRIDFFHVTTRNHCIVSKAVVRGCRIVLSQQITELQQHPSSIRPWKIFDQPNLPGLFKNGMERIISSGGSTSQTQSGVSP